MGDIPWCLLIYLLIADATKTKKVGTLDQLLIWEEIMIV